MDPPERRLGPLIGPGAAEAGIDPFGVHFEIVDEGNGGRDTLLVDRFTIGFAGDHAAYVDDQREARPCAAVVFTPWPPQIGWKRGVRQLLIEPIDKRNKRRTPLRRESEFKGGSRSATQLPQITLQAP